MFTPELYKYLPIHTNNVLNYFDSFSDAFKQVVDKIGINHSKLYQQIGMDASQFSKYYHGDIKNPHPDTRNALNQLVGNCIKKEGKKWIVIEPLHAQNKVEEDKTEYSNFTLSEKTARLNALTKELEQVLSDYRRMRVKRGLDDTTRSLVYDGIYKRIHDILSEL